MKLIAIATLGESGKVAYDAAGNRYFIPETFRKTAKAGSFAIVNKKSFTTRTKTDETGEIVLENDQPVLEACAEWFREDITFIGDKITCIKTKAESALLAAEEDAYVAQQSAALKATYKVEEAQAA